MKRFFLGLFVGVVGIHLYYFISYALHQPAHTLGYFIANDFNQALPFMIGIPVTTLALLLVYALFRTFDTSDKKRTEQAQQDAETIRAEARDAGRMDAESIINRATVEGLHLREEARKEAWEIKREALILKSQAQEEWQRVEEERQALEEDFLRKRGAYLEEIRGLRTGLTLAKKQVEIQQDLIISLRIGDEKGMARAESRLRNLKKRGEEDPDDEGPAIPE